MTVAMKSGLQRRLLLLLLFPLGVFALVSVYFDYQTAGNVAVQKDQQLRRLLPLLADSVLAPGAAPDSSPVLLLAPEVELFIKNQVGFTGFRILRVVSWPVYPGLSGCYRPPTSPSSRVWKATG